MGNVEIHDGTHPIPLARAGERCVLASLALQPGRRLHADTLIDRLWGDDPPTGGDRTIASYVRTVRKTIEDAGGRREWLRNHRPGTYELDIDPDLVDYHRFTALVAQARTRQRDGQPAEAVGLYREALELRSAEALGNVAGQWAANRRYAIEQEHLDAVCALYEQQLAISEHSAVATHATNLVLDIVPTDRMIALALHGLAGSGQHAAIPGFLTRATKRMWETAQARPGDQVITVARQLVANPAAELPLPPTVPDRQSPDWSDEDETEPTGPQVHERTPREPVRGGRITMIAEHNQHVYQAAGDQYIAGTSPCRSESEPPPNQTPAR
jgi:DNA-binding SARP family transcriptional activator